MEKGKYIVEQTVTLPKEIPSGKSFGMLFTFVNSHIHSQLPLPSPSVVTPKPTKTWFASISRSTSASAPSFFGKCAAKVDIV